MATGGLYGNTSTGTVAPQSGSESVGLYGNNTSFGGSYFEWFVFQVSDIAPATPTGGSWSFTTNTGTPPAGWLAYPPASPANIVWVSIGLVNSKTTSAITWSTPGQFSFASGLPILSGATAPASGDGQTNQLYIQTNTVPETIWFKQVGTWTALSGSTLYADLTSNQTIAGTKTFSSPIAGSVTGTSNNVTGIVDVLHGGTGSTTASAARTALGLGTISVQDASNVAITGGSISGITDLAIADGGTGASTAADARTNLGLGTIATQAASSVAITGGSITGITDLAIADGGTGASTATAAFDALAPTTTKGDLIVRNGTGNTRVPVGANDYVLVADSTQATGVKWAVAATGNSVAIEDEGTTLTSAVTSINFTGSGVTATNVGSAVTVAVANGSSGTVTSVNVSGGSTGLTTSGGPITSSGTITLAGTLAVANGGTGVTTSTGTGSNVLNTSALLVTPTLSGATVDNASPYLNYTPTTAPSYAQGRTFYDSALDSLAYYNGVTNNEVLIGQQTQLFVRNETGSTINSGSACYISGRSGSTPLIRLAKADSSTTAGAVGFSSVDIPNNTNGYLIILGPLYNINTSGFSPGSTLYLSATTAGAFTDVKPTSPNVAVRVGFSLYNNVSVGSLFASFRPVSTQASDLTGTVAVANGGSGQTTAQLAMNTFAGAVTSASYLRGNGTNVVMSAIQAADVPTLNQNTTGTAANVTGTVAIANGGTGQTTATAGFNALAPSQSTNTGKYLTTDGTNTSWATVVSGASISNDTSTATNLYPLFATVTTGTPTTVYTSNANYLYKPSTGELSAKVHVSTNGLTVNSNTVTTSYSIPSGSSAMSAGPMSVSSGITVTVPSGSRWVVI